ncbi:hypothetical protein HGP28_00800 [Vibrio sp. SM6]|uniref:Uncharacterized protein n=1 Tax=Vibrio agarilyticus TaxID=2726741 RepID=A0A7X8YF97_9VIBR|nr:hypothetical protein [Vibrio agarilyticus]NLS11424.1 hypothetical protein [Vibrio agarilyticus]
MEAQGYGLEREQETVREENEKNWLITEPNESNNEWVAIQPLQLVCTLCDLS